MKTNKSVKVRLGVKILLLVVGAIAASNGLILIATQFELENQTAEEIKLFQEQEIATAKSTLENYVSIAYEILESEYQQAHDPELLAERYGPRLRSIVDVAVGIVAQSYARFEAGELTIEDAQQSALVAIRDIRYDGGTGYVWINDNTTPIPKMVMHPTVPALDGTVLSDPKYNVAEGVGKNLFVAFADVCAEDGSGFVDYLWPKPTAQGLTEDKPKLSYVWLFEPWGWIVGTGIYIDDADAEARANALVSLKKMRYDEGVGYFWVNDTGKPVPSMIMHPTVPALDGTILDDPKYNVAYGTKKNLFTAFVEVCEADNEGYVDYLWPKPTPDGLTDDQPKLSFVRSFAPWDWIVGTGFYIDSIEMAVAAKQLALDAQMRRLTIIIAITAISLFGVAAVIALLFSRNISKALDHIGSAAARITEGNLTGERILTDRRDEIGRLAESFGTMQDTLSAKARFIHTVAAGDFSQEVPVSGENDSLGMSLVKMKESLVVLLGGLQTTISDVSSGSVQIAMSSQTLSDTASSQAGAVEEMASALEVIGKQARQNAEHSEEADAVARNSLEGAEEGTKRMISLTESIHKMADSANEIRAIVKVVEDIAFQINLLSLNANVEAARAGAKGKGFAVVAEEVRSLALRTEHALKNTSDIMEDSDKAIAKVVESSSSVLDGLQSIVDNSKSTAEKLGSIRDASSEQAQSLDEISKGLTTMEESTQSNSSNSEETASASEQLAAQARALAALIEHFTLAENVAIDPQQPIPAQDVANKTPALEQYRYIAE